MRRALMVSIALSSICVVSEGALAANDANYRAPRDSRSGPTLKSVTDGIAKANLELEQCVQKFIDRKVTPDSDSQSLGRQACIACDSANHALSDAENEFHRFINSKNPYYHGDNTLDAVPFESGVCAKGLIYAYSAIERKKEEKKKALEPTLETAMKAKLQPAFECNRKYATLFALTTKETPENIAKAGFAKCQSLFEEAADARINPIYSGGGRADMLKDLMAMFRDRALEQTTTITVESRAQQNIGSPDRTDKPVEPRSQGSKI